MKSEPDRLDLLIVALPLVLVAVMGVQIYRFVQMSGERAPGAALAEEVIGGISPPADGAAGTTEDGTAPAGSGEEAPAPAAGDQEAGTPAASTPQAGAPEDDGVEADASAEGTDQPDGIPGEAGASAEGTDQPDGIPGEADAGAESAEKPDGIPGEADAAAGLADPPATGAAPVDVVTAPETGSPQPEGALDPDARPPTPAGNSRDAAEGGTVVGGSATSDDPADTPVVPPPEDPPTSPAMGGGVTPAPDEPGDGEGPAPVDPSKPAIVTAVPMMEQVPVGQVVPVQIRIQNGAKVASVPFYLYFDPEVLKLNDEPQAERGPYLALPGIDTKFLITPGRTGNQIVFGLSLMGSRVGVNGDGLLATIHFLAIAPGESPLAFSNATVRGPDASIAPAEFRHSSVTVIP